jgi:hypothetical protein
MEVESEELPANVPEEPVGSASEPQRAAQGTSEDAGVIEGERSDYQPAIMQRDGEPETIEIPSTDSEPRDFGLKQPRTGERKGRGSKNR